MHPVGSLTLALSAVHALLKNRQRPKRSPRSQPQEPQETGEDLRDPEALAELKRATDFLTALPRFQFEATVAYDVIQEDGRRLQFEKNGDISLQRPDRLFAEVHLDDGRHRQFWYDGKTLSIAERSKKLHTQTKAPPTIDGMLDMLEGLFKDPMPLADLLYSDLSPLDERALTKPTSSATAWSMAVPAPTWPSAARPSTGSCGSSKGDPVHPQGGRQLSRAARHSAVRRPGSTTGRHRRSSATIGSPSRSRQGSQWIDLLVAAPQAQGRRPAMNWRIIHRSAGRFLPDIPGPWPISPKPRWRPGGGGAVVAGLGGGGGGGSSPAGRWGRRQLRFDPQQRRPSTRDISRPPREFQPPLDRDRFAPVRAGVATAWPSQRPAGGDRLSQGLPSQLPGRRQRFAPCGRSVARQRRRAGLQPGAAARANSRPVSAART